ncbi:MAG: cache domain-containing protein, partial [Pseudomonadota bacterium]
MDQKSGDHSAYYRALRRNMVLIIIAVSVTPLLLISLTIRYYFQVSYQDKVMEHLSVLVKKHKQNIDTFLNEKVANIRVQAKSSTVQQLSDEDFLRERLKVLQGEYGRSFVDMGVVDDRGIQIAYAGPYRLKDADYSKARWFKEAMESEQYISDVFPGLRGIPHFIVTSRMEYQGRKWLLRATVDFEAFNSLVESIRIGTTGFAFILNRKGEFQTKPRSEIVPSNEPYAGFLRTAGKPGEEVNVVELLTPSGQHYLYVTACLKNGDWLLAFQQSTDDAYSALYTARTFTLIVFFLGAVCIVAVAFLLSRRIVLHIENADLEKQMMNERVIEAGKLASLGELAAGIAHEINNPVAVMVEEAGWLQDLLDEGTMETYPNVGEFKQSLQQIRTQGSRCKQITHKLLSFARKTDPKPKPIELNDIIREVVGLCQQRVRYGNVKIVMHLASNLPTVLASPSEIQQVIMNLINNSLDAIDDHGGKIEVTTVAANGHVVVDVADDGPGIPEANLQRIFDPFFTTKPVGKGTGLGLSI